MASKARPLISDAELTRIERMFQVARRVKDIAKSILDYEEMHQKRIASMKAAKEAAERELETLTTQSS